MNRNYVYHQLALMMVDEDDKVLVVDDIDFLVVEHSHNDYHVVGNHMMIDLMKLMVVEMDDHTIEEEEVVEGVDVFDQHLNERKYENDLF